MSLLNLLKRCARRLTRGDWGESSKLLYLPLKKIFFQNGEYFASISIRMFYKKMQLSNKIYFHVTNVILHIMKDYWVSECNISTFTRILEWKSSLKKLITERYFCSHCGNTKRANNVHNILTESVLKLEYRSEKFKEDTVLPFSRKFPFLRKF
jgi:hypothetical protein